MIDKPIPFYPLPKEGETQTITYLSKETPSDLCLEKIKNMLGAHEDGVYVLEARDNLYEIILYLVTELETQGKYFQDEYEYYKGKLEKDWMDKRELLRKQYSLIDRENRYLHQLIADMKMFEPPPIITEIKL